MDAMALFDDGAGFLSSRFHGFTDRFHGFTGGRGIACFGRYKDNMD
jgi:hypothetical protein